MKQIRCVVVGGGYAGVNAIKALQKVQQELDTVKLDLILIDKHPYHLRKVLLFKPAAGESNIKVSLDSMFPTGVKFVQGTVASVSGDDHKLTYWGSEGDEHLLEYDILILAVGSLVRIPEPKQGGIALTGEEAAIRIRETWKTNVLQAVKEPSMEQKKRLLTAAVAGAGISGIETAAELAYAMRKEAEAVGLDPAAVNVYLLNSQDRLFRDGPAKVGRKLEQDLSSIGVTILHGVKAMQEIEGKLSLSHGSTLNVGLCVWTLGLLPNPALRSFGLPLTSEGQLIVDESYRVRGATGIYSIGDCAKIIDPESGQSDRMTCKEAQAQAVRLGKIISADLSGKPAPAHKKYMDVYCFGLGPDRGMVWTRQWGLDIVIGGRLGWKIRKLTWDMASLIK